MSCNDAQTQEEGESLYHEALLWYWGLEGHPVNDAAAVSSFERAADLGYPAAQFQMGVFFKCGGLRQQDTERAKLWFQRVSERKAWFVERAEGGDALSQWQLSRVIAHGLAPEYTDSFVWCRAAAEKGHALAQFDVSQCYHDGEGVAKNASEAAKWCKRAADQGMVEAWYWLGDYLREGTGIAKSEADSLRLVRRAATRGHSAAQRLLGFLYCCWPARPSLPPGVVATILSSAGNLHPAFPTQHNPQPPAAAPVPIPAKAGRSGADGQGAVAGGGCVAAKSSPTTPVAPVAPQGFGGQVRKASGPAGSGHRDGVACKWLKNSRDNGSVPAETLLKAVLLKAKATAAVAAAAARQAQAAQAAQAPNLQQQQQALPVTHPFNSGFGVFQLPQSKTEAERAHRANARSQGATAPGGAGTGVVVQCNPQPARSSAALLQLPLKAQVGGHRDGMACNWLKSSRDNGSVPAETLLKAVLLKAKTTVAAAAALTLTQQHQQQQQQQQPQRLSPFLSPVTHLFWSKTEAERAHRANARGQGHGTRRRQPPRHRRVCGHRGPVQPAPSAALLQLPL
eukprot:gene21592-33221_t